MPSYRTRAAALAIAAAGATVALGCVDPSTEHRVRANALFKAGAYAESLHECEEGLAARPDDPPLLVLEGKSAFELGAMDRARDAYGRAVVAGRGKRGVFLGDAYLGLAVVATRKGEWAVARDRFRDLLELNPNDASSHANLAKVNLELGRVDEAIEHGEAAARTRGDDEGVLFTLGKVYLAAGRHDDAEKTFGHICEVVPRAASCPYGVAIVALGRGDRARAIAKLEEAVDRRIPNPEQLASDPTLAPLRDDPAFRALVARASGAPGAPATVSAAPPRASAVAPAGPGAVPADP